MKVKLSKIKPTKFPENEVKNSNISAPYRSANVVMDPEGLFSYKIFGRLEHCECGALQKPGFCKVCENRVVDINNLPDYWFDMGLKILGFMPNWKSLDVDKIRLDNIKQVLEYTHFVYIYKFVNEEGNDDFNISVEEMPEINDEFDYDKFDQEFIYIGEEAAMLLGATKEWLDENMTDTLLIPHPTYRPLIRNTDGKPITTDLNESYQEIINRCENVKGVLKYSSSKLHDLIARYKITEIYNEIVEKLQGILQGNKFSVIRSEIISHPISGAIRGILLNRHDLNEDIMLIGDEFVESLYPYLYHKYEGDMYKINEELINKKYVMMLNRPPSISYMSIMGVMPRVASLYPREFMEGTNGGLLSNDLYVNSDNYSPNNYFIQGDIEGISPQNVGRKNYDSVPKQMNYNVRKRQQPKNIKVKINTPYDIIYPVDNITPLKRDRTSKPLSNEEKTKLDTRIANYYYQEPIEEFLYKHGCTNKDSFIMMSEVMDKVNEIKDLDDLDGMKPKGLSVQDITNQLDILVDQKHFDNHGFDKIGDINRDEAILTIAISLIQSNNLNYKTLVARQSNVKTAYSIKKKDIQGIVKEALAGVNIFNKYLADKLDKVAKANILLTEDNRRSYDYITEEFLDNSLPTVDIHSSEFDKEFENVILNKLIESELPNKQKVNYAIMENSKVKDENGDEVPTITEDEINSRRETLLKETSKYLVKIYKTEYVRTKKLFHYLDIKVLSQDGKFKPILEVSNENNLILSDEKNKAESKVLSNQHGIDKAEKEIDKLKEINDDDSKVKIKKYQDIIDKANNAINKVMKNLTRDISDIEVKDKYTINGKLNGTSTVDFSGESDVLEYIEADKVLVENVRGLSINPIIEDGLAADTDGDVLLAISVYGKKSIAEATKLLSSHRFENYANGTIRNGIIEDFFNGHEA